MKSKISFGVMVKNDEITILASKENLDLFTYRLDELKSTYGLNSPRKSKGKG